jgi:hypothetical protein
MLRIGGATSNTYTATTAGSYSCIVTANSCLIPPMWSAYRIGSALTPTITPNRTYICPGATDTLDVGTGYSSYAWSNSLGSGQKAYPTTSGTYTVTVTNGACSGTASMISLRRALRLHLLSLLPALRHSVRAGQCCLPALLYQAMSGAIALLHNR